MPGDRPAPCRAAAGNPRRRRMPRPGHRLAGSEPARPHTVPPGTVPPIGGTTYRAADRRHRIRRHHTVPALAGHRSGHNAGPEPRPPPAFAAANSPAAVHRAANWRTVPPRNRAANRHARAGRPLASLAASRWGCRRSPRVLPPPPADHTHTLRTHAGKTGSTAAVGATGAGLAERKCGGLKNRKV